MAQTIYVFNSRNALINKVIIEFVLFVIMQEQMNIPPFPPTSKDSGEGVETAKGRRTYTCPYAECGKVFTESGNLKAHIRVHVHPSLKDRLGSDPTPATTQAVVRRL